MTSSVSAAWLPGGFAAPAPSPRSGGRHSAPESAARESVAVDLGADSRGRHAEPEWARELFDPRRDDDPFDWLGFSAEQA